MREVDDTLYGLRRPTAADARAALDSVFGTEGDVIWERITLAAGVRERGSLDASADLMRLVTALRSDTDPVVQLCGHSLQIRVNAYEQAAAAQAAGAESRSSK